VPTKASAPRPPALFPESLAHALVEAASATAETELSGISAAAQPYLAALLHRAQPQRVLVVVTDGLKSQERVHADIATWLEPGPAPLFHAAWETLPHENKLPHADVISERLETLISLTSGPTDRPRIIVTSVVALLQRTFTGQDLRTRTRTLKRGDTLNPLDLIEWLEEQGYEPEAQVTGKGELSWRGGIVDVWPLSSPWPIRLEFFGDELESLREFDPAAQVSRETVHEIIIPPAGELGLLKPGRSRLAAADAPAQTPATEPALGSLLDFLPADSLLLLCEPDALLDQALRYRQQVPPGDRFSVDWDTVLAEADTRGIRRLQLSESIGVTEDHETDRSNAPSHPIPGLDAYRPIGSALPDPQIAEAQRREFFQQLHRWMRQDHQVHVFCGHEGERQRFRELWTEFALPEPPPECHIGVLSRGFIVPEARLVIVTDAEIYGRYKVQRPRRLKSRHASAVRSVFEVDFTEFEEGDFVVHLENGIGIYRGLKTLPPQNRRRGEATSNESTGDECLVIEYAPSGSATEPPRLYVPVSEAHLVSKYVGAGKARPQLSTLGGNRWTKAKEQAQRAVRDLAAELLTVQATRATQPGYAFPTDAPWQREFEASFEYEETPDQLRAIAAAKTDMEAAKPMDRLLCGDVGFGKTEVAIRAAFKAVLSGKQVAILVPTTVLAQQHYNNFRDRMAEYPVRIELLSRFRSPKQQRAVLEAAASGTVDIVIGTHRIVSSDVQFKDLGLVVVDEEQKFGVRHKEQFKLLRQTIDVLTLSATPIPRTLYLALTGARDLSTLETPPQDRLPVETVVTNYDERLIRDAIQREINRGGQVYFLHNRVSSIEALALRIRALLPEARVLVGHGQMDPDDLERVMTRFVNGEADVLVSTTIIESGLDIPNANTIIIDRADRFGLSELYQLRGRVGRYKHQAYAYLLLPRHAQLLTEARKRMSAIKQYSALGSGFKIAMRDLEIRGAGNLLGAQQSGHITAVGFDLYCQLLGQSISSLKGESPKPRVDVRARIDFLALNPAEAAPVPAAPTDTILDPNRPRITIRVPRDSDVWSTDDDGDDDNSSTRSGRGRKKRSEETDAPAAREPAFLPLDYIREPAQRIEIHRKLAQLADKAGLDGLRRELRDRFGPLPPPVDLLLELAELRIFAAAHRITGIEVTEGKLKLTRNNDLVTIGGHFPRLTKRTASARIAEIRRLIQSLGK
jgi:transcription-repair coupling factor (superfamily II helicase)